MSTQPQSDAAMRQALLTIYDINFDHAMRLIADVDDNRMAVQPMPKMNHPAWVLGHLTSTCDVAMMGLGQPKVAPQGWREHFGPRSEPSPDPSSYPDKQTLIDSFREARGKVRQTVADLDPQKLLEPPADERFRERWPTLAQMLLHVMIGHEQMHLGQLSAWRRTQGLPPI